MEISKKTLLWGVIAVLFVVVLVLTFKVSGNAASGSGKIDMSGWTQNEIMNYEMHGIVPARAQSTVKAASSSPGSGGMVGGC